MKIQHLIDEQIDQFSKRFAVRLMELGSVDEVTYQSIVRSEGKSFFNFLSRKLIEALGSELIGGYEGNEVQDCPHCGMEQGGVRDEMRTNQRLKLKEILSNIK